MAIEHQAHERGAGAMHADDEDRRLGRALRCRQRENSLLARGADFPPHARDEAEFVFRLGEVLILCGGCGHERMFACLRSVLVLSFSRNPFQRWNSTLVLNPVFGAE